MELVTTSRSRLLLLLLVTLPGVACVSLEQSAPLPETLPTAKHAGTPSQLAQGREIYITKCAACHSVEPVRKYSRAEWEHEIMPDMAEETNLTPAETAAVIAYIRTVLNTPAPET